MEETIKIFRATSRKILWLVCSKLKSLWKNKFYIAWYLHMSQMCMPGLGHTHTQSLGVIELLTWL